MTKKLELKGQRFGRLLVISDPIIKRKRNGQKQSWFMCQCNCGNQKEIASSSLRQGVTKSCGCLKKELKIKSNTTHGKTKTKEHIAWLNMKGRCYNPGRKDYAEYGAKGIKVCDEWRNSFEAFYEYMGDAPSETHSIDRLDPEDHYEPGNVEWGTEQTQAIRRRIQKNNTSGVRGVQWYEPSKKWRAVIGVNKKTIHLGYFENKKDAVAARKAAEEKYHAPLLKKQAR